MKDFLAEEAARLGIMLSDEQLNQFSDYADCLIDWNTRINLTSITDPHEIAVKHFVDSLIGARFISNAKTLCDVGSGAGFPGLPLKIFRPDLEVTLLDSLSKRVTFLNAVIEFLKLRNIVAIHARAEEAGRMSDFREHFDLVTSRAVARLNTLCEYALPLVKVGGHFLAYKGDAEQEIKESGYAIRVLGGKIEKIDSFSLSSEAEKRCLILIKKISPTPKQYPRGKGKERSAPLADHVSRETLK